MLKKLRNIYHFFVSLGGSLLYRRPSRKIFVLGVTGTKGKTTVIELINAGLEEAGKKTAVMSSIRHKVGAKTRHNSGNSMPGRFALQKFLSDAVKENCDYALIEVTSEGVVQHRHRNIDFDAGMFINLHPEHIESHGSFENYRNAKLRFFGWMKAGSGKKQKYFLINGDDENANYFIDAAGGHPKIVFGKSDKTSQLVGDFNKWNLGAAEAFLEKVAGIPHETVLRAFEKFRGVPGRMEYIQREPFEVLIDYAHTPNSLEAAYESASHHGKKKLICVLGSASGGRDKWKRPRLGEIAGNYCKEIILTDEDPYDEDPHQILRDIRIGIPKEFRESSIHEIIDRRSAIKKAINLAKPGDTVIMTGKGSEKSIHVAGGRKIPWDEAVVAMEALKELEL